MVCGPFTRGVAPGWYVSPRWGFGLAGALPRAGIIRPGGVSVCAGTLPRAGMFRPVGVWVGVAGLAAHNAVVKLVDRILVARRANPAVDLTVWKREIDWAGEMVVWAVVGAGAVFIS